MQGELLERFADTQSALIAALDAGDTEAMIAYTRDLGGITDALRTLMDDPELRRRLGAEALETARAYEAGAIAERWVALAEDVEAFLEGRPVQAAGRRGAGLRADGSRCRGRRCPGRGAGCCRRL